MYENKSEEEMEKGIAWSPLLRPLMVKTNPLGFPVDETGMDDRQRVAEKDGSYMFKFDAI